MKAAEKMKIAEMMLDLLEAEAGDHCSFDRDDCYGDALDILEEMGFEHLLRRCDPPKEGETVKFPPPPRDTKGKVHVMIARINEGDAYHWFGASRADQLWVALDRDFAMKALLFNHIPKEPLASPEEARPVRD